MVGCALLFPCKKALSWSLRNQKGWKCISIDQRLLLDIGWDEGDGGGCSSAMDGNLEAMYSKMGVVKMGVILVLQ